MYIKRMLSDGTIASIVVQHDVEMRLKTRCFRKIHIKCAGNFIKWRNSMQVLNDRNVMPYILDELNRQWFTKDFSKVSLSIDLPYPVGWESTDEARFYKDTDLEEFAPSKNSTAMRIKKVRTDLLSPKTNKVTIIFDFKIKANGPVAMIYSIYPGKDIGSLHGDITEREQRVFFDWNHPGT